MHIIRHEVELKIKQNRIDIEGLERDIEMCVKKKKVIESHLKFCQEELEAFQVFS